MLRHFFPHYATSLLVQYNRISYTCRFVPRQNTHDAIGVSLPQLLRASGEQPPEPGAWGGAGGRDGAGGWEGACDVLRPLLGFNLDSLQLRATAPEPQLVLALRAALAGEEGATALVARLDAMDASGVDDDEEEEEKEENEGGEGAVAVRVAQVVAAACAGLEAALPTTLEHDTAEMDEPITDQLADPAVPAARVLLELRASRKRLLRQLRASMEGLAASDPRGVSAALAALQCQPSTYPHLDAIPLSELDAWASRAWDWEAGRFEQ